MRKDNSFTLYDLHQNFYLQEGNKPEDDQAPKANTADAYVYTNAKKAESTPTVETATTSPKFLSNVELKSDRMMQPETTTTLNTNTTEPETTPKKRPEVIGKTEPVATEKKRNSLPMRNSDCPTPLDTRDFDDLYKKIEGKNENVKLKFLLSKMDKCYTTAQARILAKALK